jgi:hypothetical protein
METNFDHNKLLKKIARDRLKSHSIVQKGTSRTFLYDSGWYVIMIEFQPSAWDKGSYLNIGVDLNFYPSNDLAFSYGYREKGFSGAEDEKQFIEIVGNYCDHVIKKTQSLKEEFKDISTAIDNIERRYPDDSWHHFDLGILYGLTGNTKKAKYFLNKLARQKCEYDYEFERQKASADLLSLLSDKEKFLSHTKELIARSRQLKKLPTLDTDLLPATHTSTKTSLLKSLFGKK